jgi:hypothetical protein
MEGFYCVDVTQHRRYRSTVKLILAFLATRCTSILCSGDMSRLHRGGDLTNLTEEQHHQQLRSLRTRSLSKNDETNNDFTCFNSNQVCSFFNIFNNGTCPLTRQFCPPPMTPGNSPEATCAPVGKFCRTEYICNFNAITEDCCGDCQSYVVNCCPQWCNSCVPTSIRCDLYNYFAKANNDRTTLLRFRIYYQTTLCVPNQLGFRCDDQIQANHFCTAYVASGENDTSTSLGYSLSKRCLKNCIKVVSNPKYCPCTEPVPE